jgi:hypothetical protein
VRSAVGVDITEEARRILPRDERADGFTNTAYNLGVDLAHIEAYARLAKLIVDRMDVKAFAAKHATCTELSESCMRQLIAAMGKRLLREMFGDVRSLAKEAGLINPATKPIWKALGISGRPSRYRSEPMQLAS